MSKTPRFDALKPASLRTSRTAARSSRKKNTRCELVLRRELAQLGLRYRIDVAALPGRPDVVFSRARVAVFCDGDFWHGRNLATRVAKLKRGHNAPYWVAKIKTNVARDERHNVALADAGWLVLRFWETDIHEDVTSIAEQILEIVTRRYETCSTSRSRARAPKPVPG